MSKGSESYNDDPVYYCKRCLSLGIRQVPLMKNLDYCEDCGAVDIGVTDIEEWQKMYRKKFGCNYIERK